MTPPRESRPDAVPPKLDIHAEDLRTARDILRRQIPGLRVVAYGSRTRGRARPFSDLDLAIVSARPVDGKTLAELAIEFTRSNLPMRADISEWRDFSESFRRAIADDCVVIQNGE